MGDNPEDENGKISYLEALDLYKSSIPNHHEDDILEGNANSLPSPLDPTPHELTSIDSTLENFIAPERHRCLVCNGSVTSEHFFSCSKCSLSSHFNCFNPLSKDFASDFTCAKCSSSTHVSCVICGCSHGLLKRLDHVFHPCCLLYGLFNLSNKNLPPFNPLGNEDINKLVDRIISNIPNYRKKCIVCSNSDFFAIPCGYPHCPHFIHPSCAIEENLGAVNAIVGFSISATHWSSIFCPSHSKLTYIRYSCINFLRLQRIISSVKHPKASTLSSLKFLREVKESINTETTPPAEQSQNVVSTKPIRPPVQTFYPFSKASWQKADNPRRAPIGPAASRALALLPLGQRKKFLEESRNLLRLFRPKPLSLPPVPGIKRILHMLKRSIWSSRGSDLYKNKTSRYYVLISISKTDENYVTPHYLLATFLLKKRRAEGYEMCSRRILSVLDPQFSHIVNEEMIGQRSRFVSHSLNFESFTPLSPYEYDLVRRGIVEISQNPLRIRFLLTPRSPTTSFKSMSWGLILQSYLGSLERPQEKPIENPTEHAQIAATPANQLIELGGYHWALGTETNFISNQIDLYKSTFSSVYTDLFHLKSLLLDSILSQNSEPLRPSELPSCKHIQLVADSCDRWSLLKKNLVLMATTKVIVTKATSKGNIIPPTCCVCFTATKTNLNPLISCVRCCIVYHRSCYGVGHPTGGSSYPNRDWDSGELACRRCEVEKKVLGTQWITNFTRNSVLCAVCLRGGGAFKSTTLGNWVHPFCGFTLIPLARPMDPSLLEPWLLPPPKCDLSETCCVCSVSAGITIQCQGAENCSIWCHPMCAWLQGFAFHVKDDPDTRLFEGNIQFFYSSFKLFFSCPEHSEDWDPEPVRESRRLLSVNRDLDPAYNEARRKGRLRGCSRPLPDTKHSEMMTPTTRLSMPSYDSKTCAVCFSSLSRDSEISTFNEDLINHTNWIRCDGCRVAVHAKCYMIDISGTLGLFRESPTGLATCPTPIILGNSLKSAAPGGLEDLTKMKRWLCDPCSLGTTEALRCAICQRKGFGLKAWIYDNVEGNSFLHISCLIWHPDVAVNLIKNPTYLLQVKPMGMCVICSSNKGILLKCSRISCTELFHASCAAQAGLLLYVGPDPQRMKERICLCSSHSQVATRFSSSLLLFFRIKESFNMARMLATDMATREVAKRAWIRKRKQTINTTFQIMNFTH